MTLKITSFKKSSLRRKDSLWIYKNPQGLQLLDDELKERRKKRVARNRVGHTSYQPTSPPLSPINISPEQVIPIATPLMHKSSSQSHSKTIPITMPTIERKPTKPSLEKKSTSTTISQIKNALENNASTSVHHSGKVTQPEQMSRSYRPPSPERKFTLKQETKKEFPPKQYTPESKETDKKFTPNQGIQPKKEPFSKQSVSKVQEKEQKREFPLKQVVTRVQEISSPKKEFPVRQQTTRLQETPPKRKAIQEIERKWADMSRQSSFAPIQNVRNTVLKEAQRPNPKTSASTNDNSSFLMEAKQKLFTVQQQQQQLQRPIKKTLPSTSITKQGTGSVSSFVSAFEPPKSPTTLVKSSIEPSTPLASLPFTPPDEKAVPLETKSFALPQTESYFSAVIDRRFSPSPTGSEDTIHVYLPQLSPEISFCNNSNLNVPSDDECERPGIKKRVSFSDQLSTVIPDEDDDEEPLSKFTRTLSHELSEAKEILVAEKKVNISPRAKYVPVTVKSRPPSPPKHMPSSNRPSLNSRPSLSNSPPQKLSNKLLDMFQKKPKVSSPTPVPVAAPLTHLTKSRPRKPASLKKPTTLAYPAAIAQPDWRTRAVTSKKAYAS